MKEEYRVEGFDEAGMAWHEFKEMVCFFLLVFGLPISIVFAILAASIWLVR